MSGCRGTQEVMEVAVFREDVAEGFVYNFICCSMQKCRVLIDQRSSRFIEPDAGGDLAGLDDFKQWHGAFPFRWNYVVFED